MLKDIEKMRAKISSVRNRKAWQLLLLLGPTLYIAQLPIEVKGATYRESRKVVMDILMNNAQKMKNMIGIDLNNHVSIFNTIPILSIDTDIAIIIT